MPSAPTRSVPPAAKPSTAASAFSTDVPTAAPTPPSAKLALSVSKPIATSVTRVVPSSKIFVFVTTFSAPLIVAALGWAWRGERTSPLGVIGLIVGMVRGGDRPQPARLRPVRQRRIAPGARLRLLRRVDQAVLVLEAQQRAARLLQPLPGWQEARFHVEHPPIQKLATNFRGTFQQPETVWVDELQR